MMEPATGLEPVSAREDVAPSAQHMQTAAHRAEEIREIVGLEREQLAAEREKMAEELRQERARLDEERQARIRELETELAQVRVNFENERALRASEETDRRERERLEVLERHESIRAQLSDITSLVQEQRDKCTGRGN